MYTINEPVVAFIAEDRWHTSKAGVEAIVFDATRAATEIIVKIEIDFEWSILILRSLMFTC